MNYVLRNCIVLSVYHDYLWIHQYLAQQGPSILGPGPAHAVNLMAATA